MTYLHDLLQLPTQGKEPIKQKMDALHNEIQEKFRQLGE